MELPSRRQAFQAMRPFSIVYFTLEMSKKQIM
jgi:hypothetical protein